MPSCQSVPDYINLTITKDYVTVHVTWPSTLFKQTLPLSFVHHWHCGNRQYIVCWFWNPTGHENTWQFSSNVQSNYILWYIFHNSTEAEQRTTIILFSRKMKKCLVHTVINSILWEIYSRVMNRIFPDIGGMTGKSHGNWSGDILECPTRGSMIIPIIFRVEF